mgnify:CR=1 FL=1
MELDNHILAVVEPAILPTEIKMEALSEDQGENVDKQTKEIGAFEPFILCNGVQINITKLDSFELDLSGIMPLCTIDFTDSAFGVDSMPRDGDFFTVLLNSKHQETFKSVHMDFDIIEVNSDETGGVILEGICKIPRMYKEDCQVLDTETSLKQLELVVRDLEIGLATNVDSTDDKQSRIQAYETYQDFITSIIEDSYISDEAFVKYCVDQYYYLNYAYYGNVLCYLLFHFLLIHVLYLLVLFLALLKCHFPLLKLLFLRHLLFLLYIYYQYVVLDWNFC